MRQAGLFGLTEHLERLSKDGDPPEVLEATVDFEFFRPWLVEGLDYGDGSKGGRPPFGPVSMFKALILQSRHNLSDARMEFMIRHFRNRLTETDAEARHEGLRLAAAEEGVYPDGGPDRGCVPRAGAQAAQHGRREYARERHRSEVWADSACRSRRNEKWLAKRMLTSRIHRRKPAGRPMPQATARAKARNSAVRAAVEHVFAHQKSRFGVRHSA